MTGWALLASGMFLLLFGAALWLAEVAWQRQHEPWRLTRAERKRLMKRRYLP